jgi:CCR4-NOT transcriptional complex subunit CAF120
MFEHASLQELYTGSLIAGKGKHLNNIRTIMEKTKLKTEDWARVRFGAGTPWRRCWCVIEPPDEKEWHKSNKALKKKSAYDRPSKPKGEIKFYDTKKTKKATPIATITDAYSAYAIYPQAKPLIEQSTLVKVEGRITIHSTPESKTEGFVFVMPELHPAVSGFEMMLRWLFPVYDIFHLYGRPQRLIADTWDTRGLMFAMPKERRYGYLDIIDVAALIHTQGSDKWTEREWRKQLKDMTSKRIAMTAPARSSANLEGRVPGRAFSESRQDVHYDDKVSIRSTPSARHQHNQSTDAVFASPQRISTVPANGPYLTPGQANHSRAVSESVAYVSPTKSRRQNETYQPSRLSTEYPDEEPIQPTPPPPPPRNPFKNNALLVEVDSPDSRHSSDSESQAPPTTHPEDVQADVRELTPPAPVSAPPVFQHHAGDVPQKRPDARPDLRRENSRMSNATLSQMVDVNRVAGSGAAGHAAMVAWSNNNAQQGEDQGNRGVNETHRHEEMSANQLASQAMVADGPYTQSPADVRPDPDRHPSEPSTTRKTISRKPVPTPSPSLLALPKRSQSPDSMSRYSTSHLDSESAGTPDYDSLPEDPEGSTLPRRTRTGVLRTVGDPALGRAIDPVQGSRQVDIPVVDFGTTITPTLTPGHSRPATASGITGRQSPLGYPHTAPTTPLTRSPHDDKTLPGRQTPGDERRRSSADRISPQLHHSRGSSYAWLPGATAGRQSPGGGLTAEEFVQQRAAAARIPHGHVPHRSVSYSNIERSPSQLQKKRDSRDPYARPSSRNSLLIDYSSHLSAREQEHVARMTGGPLIQVGERSKTPDPSIGLIGAIEARQQEKRNIRDGLAGHMVQEAIAQRQAVERTHGYPQSSPYGYPNDARQNGQWINPPPSAFWASATTSQTSPVQQPWQGQQLSQYPPVQAQQMHEMSHPAYSGYQSAQRGYGSR